MTQTARAVRYSGFVILALAVNALVFLFSARGLRDPVRTALFFDCAISVPVCYWLLLVRSGLRGKTSLVLISAVSVLRGAYLLNSRIGMVIGIAVEAALITLLATRVKRLEDVLPSKTLARIARAEIDVYRYAFGRPKQNALAEGARVFTIHESSGAASLFWLLALLTPVETGIVHWILPTKLAWIFTALGVYAAIWMIAVARSFPALPIVVDAAGVTLRRGIMASMYIPREAIARVSRKDEGGTYARFAVLADPAVWIVFNRPLKVELPMGFTREVRGVAIAPDDVQGFLKALNEN